MSTDHSTVPAKCVECEAVLDAPIVCKGCRALYPIPPAMGYFELLGIEHRYAVDESRLMSAFRAIARNVHPDRFDDGSPETRALAIKLSAQMNEAISVLRDPLLRADYMLTQAGGPGASEIRDVPGMLLGEIMMLREQVEEAQANKDADTLDRVRVAITERRAESLAQIARQADNLTACDDAAKKDFRKLLNSIKYFDNLLSELAIDPLATDSDNRHG